MPEAKSYYSVPQTGNAGEARLLVHRHTFTAAAIDALDSEKKFFRVPRGFIPGMGSFEFSANDGGAGAGRVSVILTDGTTEYELVQDQDVSTADHVSFAVAGDNDWLGQFVNNDNDWYIGIKATTAFSAAVAAGHYAISVVFTTNPAPDTF